jgi:predicted phosphoadenosine phosphosulfate sulfurtransferase
MWEERCYREGIPDEAPFELGDKVPSYKKICIAILKNDTNLVSLGYKTKYSKYYSVLKRIEIDARPTKYKQLKLRL